MLGRVALVTSDVKEERIASIITVFLCSVLWLLVTTNRVLISPILVILMIEAILPPKRWFLHKPHGVTFQKMAFFIVTTVKTSYLTYANKFPQ
jgi:hypothetical protein